MNSRLGGPSWSNWTAATTTSLPSTARYHFTLNGGCRKIVNAITFWRVIRLYSPSTLQTECWISGLKITYKFLPVFSRHIYAQFRVRNVNANSGETGQVADLPHPLTQRADPGPNTWFHHKPPHLLQHLTWFHPKPNLTSSRWSS